MQSEWIASTVHRRWPVRMLTGAQTLTRKPAFPLSWRSTPVRAVPALVLALCMLGIANAQPAAAPVPAPAASAARSLPPFVDPIHELKGAALAQALRSGGFVLYMRHADAGDSKAPCPNESMLTPQGEEQARTVGAALRQLKVPIASVQASETCRAKDTARLLEAGPVVTRADLNPVPSRLQPAEYAQRFRYLLEPPPKGSNTLLVSHVQGSSVRDESILIEQAEIAVYRPRVTGRPELVARIAVDAWPALIVAASQASLK